ncbi:hypothetical protein [Pontibacter sp. HSC-36F09]|nr:hypothetical protein [Pontibacter sp. HSC-36F09]MCP2044246.1 hypothetical protein [Pontibacter sp. HSC-36F09]
MGLAYTYRSFFCGLSNNQMIRPTGQTMSKTIRATNKGGLPRRWASL